MRPHSLALAFASLTSMLTPNYLVAQKQAVTTPAQAFGFEPGTDRKLADWTELTAYFQTLSKQTDRIRYDVVGKTTEGRPFVTLTISAPENLAHLEDYKQIQSQLADPRATTPEQAKALIARGKTILVVTCNVHSTEIASSQSAALFAYRLATDNSPETEAILHDVILILVPSLNPDGQQLVVDWYKKTLGTPSEGSSPVVLWHHYVGHDDNRDWSSFTQVETRLAVEKVLNPWHPEILYDIHQMGSFGPRIYLPPWVDPVDPNVDPLLVSSMNALGTNTALEISETGKQGVLIHGVYDFWSPLRDYIALHNGLRVLTESASVNIASPIDIPFSKLDHGIGYDAKRATWNFPDPWKGGRWTLGDIVSYQQDAFFSIARNASTYRERFLSDFYKLGEHAVRPRSGPFAYVIPAAQRDAAATARLVNTLLIGDTEVEQSSASFTANGQTYPAGSYIVRLAQPFGAFAKSILEIQDYPNIPEYPGGPLQRPYDVTAQTMPLLLGVDAVAIPHEFTLPSTTRLTAQVHTGSGTFQQSPGASAYALEDRTNSDLYALFALLGKGLHARRIPGAGEAPDTILLPQQKGLDAALVEVVAHLPVAVRPADTALLHSPGLEVHLPRIALYQSWVPSMDEGWTRWIFDQNSIPYTRVTDNDIRRGDLHARFDAILLPDNSPAAITSGRYGRGGEDGPQPPPEFRGGLGNSGLNHLHQFAEDGGTLIALNRAAEVFSTRSTPVANALEALPAKDFYIPGSILQVAVDTSDPLAFGSRPLVPIFFEQSPAFRVGDPAAHATLTYQSDTPLLSGWILGGDHLRNTAALVTEPLGKGRLILFGFRPQYRAQSEVTYRFLFNALLLSSSQPSALQPAQPTAKGRKP